MKKTSLFAAGFLGTAMFCGGLLTSAPAAAQYYYNDRGYNYGWSSDRPGIFFEDGRLRFGNPNTFTVRSRDRAIIRRYIKDRPYYCPPGLFRRFDCVPPGYYRTFSRGEILPYSIAAQRLPYDLLVRLRRPPGWADYVRVGNDVYLLDGSTREILDVIR